MRSIVITINDNKNYGNRLQNYALIDILKKYGPAYTANCDLPSDSVIKRILRPVAFFCFRVCSQLRNIYKGSFWNERARLRRFSKFTKAKVDDSRFKVDGKRGLTPLDSSAVIVIGSDQVWNYQWVSKRGLRLRLGSFALNGQRVISYAASFGVSEINDDAAKMVFQKYLPRLKAISVREDRGAELVKEIAGLDATVVLDPTLMLTADKWMKITEGFVSEGDEYVLTYFLGSPSDEQERDIRGYARVHGCRIRRILDLRDKETYVAGPQDFVELFSKAQYVFTDSYHACCFSILFHKQFTVFNRAGMTGKASMNSRMETLFRLFDLNSVMMDSGLAPEIDYEKVDRLLEQHRKGSQNWLDKAMEE